MDHRETLVRVNIALTGVFAATAFYAAVDFSTSAQWVGAITAMSLFAIGVFAFLWSYWSAVQRSRTSEISVTQLYLLMGDAIPGPVRRSMNLALLAQAAIAIITTFMRPNGPDGNPGSALAVGFLVPMLGFGLNGLWAVTHGNFAVRTELRHSKKEIRQNADHG
jgi:hypothetical protein